MLQNSKVKNIFETPSYAFSFHSKGAGLTFSSWLRHCDCLRPDLVLVLNNATVFVLELTVRVESNISLNSDPKANKYHFLIGSLLKSYSKVKFVNHPMSALGIFETSSESLLKCATEINEHIG